MGAGGGGRNLSFFFFFSGIRKLPKTCQMRCSGKRKNVHRPETTWGGSRQEGVRIFFPELATPGGAAAYSNVTTPRRRRHNLASPRAHTLTEKKSQGCTWGLKSGCRSCGGGGRNLFFSFFFSGIRKRPKAGKIKCAGEKKKKRGPETMWGGEPPPQHQRAAP